MRIASGLRGLTATALCAVAGLGFAADPVVVVEPSSGIDPARVDRLMDASRTIERMDFVLDEMAETKRAGMAEESEQRRERIAVGLELLRFTRLSFARNDWRDAIARQADPKAFAEAEAFFASEAGRAFADCVAAASSAGDVETCLEDPRLRDLPDRSTKHLEPDFMLKFVDQDGLQAVLSKSTCRGLGGDRPLLERLHASCLVDGEPPVCALAIEREGRVVLNPDICALR